jgi:MraZ protein
MNGTFKYSLDEKGRLMIPVKMREEIGGNLLIITRGLDKYLWLFPPVEWKDFSEKLLEATSIFQEKARLILRRIIAPAQDVEVDKTGRIMIPPTLREYAGLKKECMILGLKRFVEIWDEDQYIDYDSKNEEAFQDAVKDLNIKW